MKPLISVLIPSYNYGRYIERAIDSVLAQTYANFEVVVTDNRSNDDTMEVLRRRYAADARVRIFENEANIGLMPNFNRALEHARGDFVVWLCADDWFLTHHLERLHDVFQRHAQIDVVYTNIFFADEHGRTYSIKAETSQLPFDYVDIRDELPEMLETMCQLCLPTALFRRSLFRELGPLDESIPTCADWEIAIRFAAEGKRFAYLFEPSVCVRAHGANASGSAFHHSGGYVLELLQIAESYVDHPGLRRLYGRQSSFIAFIERMIESVRGALGRDPFGDDVYARLEALRTKFAAHAGRFEPARVRESRVSVIVPVHRLPGEAFAAIDSVCAQSFSNWEIVVVDAGPLPVRELIRDHPAADRIVYARLPAALPPGGARNFGLRLARGEYIAFLDDDNRFLPHHLETVVAAIERSGAAVVASSARLVVVRDDPRGLENEKVASVEGLFRGPESDWAHESSVVNSLPLNAVLAHRAAFVRAGSFNSSVALLEDFDQIMRFEAIAPIVLTPGVTLEVCARLGLAGQTMGTLRAFYLPTLDALYGARLVEPALAAARVAHRARVEAVLERFDTLTADVNGLVAFLATLTGRRLDAV